ncbi:MAG: DUF4190 domain-containing protein [Nocardioides sp.]
MSYTPPPPPPEQGGSGEPSDTPSGATPPGATPPGYGAPPPPPPGYGAPGYGGPSYGGAPRNSSKAVASLVVGIISPILGFCCAVIGLVGIVAIVLGRSAQKEIAASNGTLTGEGMAKAGVILGIIGTVIGVAMTVLNIVLLMSGETTFNFNTSP